MAACSPLYLNMINIMIKQKFTKLFQKKQPEHTSNTDPFVFVHIPKTAGTSFRVAIQQHESVYCDYGKQSEFTSPDVTACLYKLSNFYELKQRILKRKGEALCGHFPIQRFADFAPITHQVTFVREPIKRVISHYNHFVTYNNFEGDLISFVKKHMNVQSRALHAIPIELIGQLGITECYAESLNLINSGLNSQYVALTHNVKTQNHIDELQLNDELLQTLQHHNQDDIVLYQKAIALHQQRVALFEAQKEWTYIHAKVNDNHVIHGCAFYQRSPDPVQLDVYINGNFIRSFMANQFYGLHPKFIFPRDRYIAFRYEIPKHFIGLIETIELRVVSTQQNYVITQ